MTKYKRLDGESDDELIYRVCQDKELIGTWNDVKDILNELLNADYGESTYRKKYQSFEKLFKANQSKFIDNDILTEIAEQKRALEEAKVQYRDERAEWNKQNRISARANQKLDYLEEQLGKLGNVNFETHDIPYVNNDNDMLIILSDLHIGQTFHSQFGSYDTDIAKGRLNEYLSEIIKIQKRHGSQNAYISIQGDLISNNIHKTIAISNRENVIDQIKIAVEYITSFCYELTKVFNHVYMANCSGNHSRLDKKEEALHSERLDDLICWSVGNTLAHIENFTTLDDNNYDIGISSMIIRGREYCGVHGDFDAFNQSAVSKLALMLGHIPYAVTMGHRHYSAFDNSCGIRIVQGGSLAGGGDDYSIEKRLNGQPSQTVCICNNRGIECMYPIILH